MCSSFCRSSIKCGGLSIFVKKSLNFCNFDISFFCRKQDFECCAAKVKFDYGTYVILTAYMAPSGNFSNFITQLERVLNQLYSNNANILVSGDFNVNFATDTERKVRLISLLDSFNLDLRESVVPRDRCTRGQVSFFRWREKEGNVPLTGNDYFHHFQHPTL